MEQGMRSLPRDTPPVADANRKTKSENMEILL